jgi:hypothetical protein
MTKLLSLLEKLIHPLTAPRPPKPQAVCRGWQMQLWHWVMVDGGELVFWHLVRPNGAIHALVIKQPDRLDQYYDWEEMGPRRN